MTVRNHSIRRISGIALLALFLTFVAVQVFPRTKDEAGDNPCDESRLNEASGPAIPLFLRNNPKNSSNGGLIDKSTSGLLPTAAPGYSLIANTIRTAVKKAVPQLLSNPFYVVLSAKAP